MYKKEFLDTLRVFLQSLLVLLVIPIALALDWYLFHAQWQLAGIIQPVILGIILFFAAYGGVTIFAMERKDRALEYLLSLPVPKSRILFAKILPRLLFLLVLIACGSVLGVMTSPVMDGISVLIVFIVALSLSLSGESIFNALIGVVLVNVIFYYSSIITSYLTMTRSVSHSLTPVFWLSFGVPLVVVVVPLLTAFYKTLKKFDLKPLKWQTQAYIQMALPAIGCLVIFILVFLKKYLAWIKIVE